MGRPRKVSTMELQMATPTESTPGTWYLCKPIDAEFTLEGDFAVLASHLNAAIEDITWTVTDEEYSGFDCHRLSGTV